MLKSNQDLPSCCMTQSPFLPFAPPSCVGPRKEEEDEEEEEERRSFRGAPVAVAVRQQRWLISTTGRRAGAPLWSIVGFLAFGGRATGGAHTHTFPPATKG